MVGISSRIRLAGAVVMLTLTLAAAAWAGVDPAEEQAMIETCWLEEAANRARALTGHDPGREGRTEDTLPPLVAQADATAADRTVGSPPCQFPTIGAALAAANPGDHLLLEGGVTFTENPVVSTHLTLEGGYAGCGSGSTARTTIDGGAAGSVVAINAGVTAALADLIVTNGYTGTEGGGIRLGLGIGGATLNLTNVRITGCSGYWGGGLWVGPDCQVIGTGVEIDTNTAITYGGGVRLYGGRATFRSSNIHHNVAPNGGGVFGSLQGGFGSVLSLPDSADVYQNEALTGDGQGGGVYMQGGVVSVAACSDIDSNDAISGGGLFLVDSTLTVDGTCSEVQVNAATGNGGGVYAQSSTVNLIDGAELYGNDAGGSGGGAYLDDSSLYSDLAKILYNTSGGHGGGVYAANGSTLDMDIGPYTCASLGCSSLRRNTAGAFGYGGGVYASDSLVDLRTTLVDNNSADLGGAIYAVNTAIVTESTLIARNNATGGYGDAIRANNSAGNSTISAVGTTVAFNDSTGGATGDAIAMDGEVFLSLDCSIVWGHATSISSPDEDVVYSDIEGGYTGTGNLDTDPLFVSVAGQDFHLQLLSPLIDRCAGAGELGIDMDGDLRPSPNSSTAWPYDMGADEVIVGIFADGFESGDTSSWSLTVP